MNNIQHKNIPPEIHNLKGWIQLVDENILKDTFSGILTSAGFTVLDFSSHQFPVNGYTAFWLLAESHLALHTFTESGWCYIELSSCNSSKTKSFKQITSKLNYLIHWDEKIHISEPEIQKTEF